jgi:N-acetylmuramic acid 6-phosphate etherase
MSLAHLTTEQRNPLTNEIDEKSTREILKCINDEDQKVAKIVQSQLDHAADAVDVIVRQMKIGGRLIYVGCGSSGRMGVVDAVECSVTYGVAEGTVVGVIAGGVEALHRSVEKLEDSYELPINDLKKLNLNETDVIVGIAASGRTPYVIGALRYAKSLSCPTISVVCNDDSPMADESLITICTLVGPEVVTGSTRMKAGTAQKLILNMLSTAAMIKLGKCFGNLMIDFKADACSKLRDRAVRIFCDLTERRCDDDDVRTLLEICNWELKTAILMELNQLNDPNEARKILSSVDGRLKEALTKI